MGKHLMETTPKDLVVGIVWYSLAMIMIGIGAAVLIFKLLQWLF